jgi:hypothetical protein
MMPFGRLLVFMLIFAVPAVAQSSRAWAVTADAQTFASLVFDTDNATQVTAQVNPNQGNVRIDVLDANGNVVAGASQTLEAGDVHTFTVPAGGRLRFSYYPHTNSEGTYSW